MKKLIALFIAVCLLTVSGCGEESSREPVAEKPVIYLYPEEKTLVHVELDFNGEVTSTYPAYENGWDVLARPDGTLTDPQTGREYYCLFWEGM